MGERRGVYDRVVLIDEIDIGKVSMDHEQQVAEGELRTLRAARRTTGIEQPGGIFGFALDVFDGLAGKQFDIVRVAG